jgi:hypothetical protein
LLTTADGEKRYYGEFLKLFIHELFKFSADSEYLSFRVTKGLNLACSSKELWKLKLFLVFESLRIGNYYQVIKYDIDVGNIFYK